MIISPGRNYVFVHIPKTGGTAFATALEGRAMRDDILIGDTPKARRRAGRLKGTQSAGRLWKHSTLADIEGLVSAEWLAQTCAVTLVRNPWDRIVSYYHWLRVQRFAHPAVALAQRGDFAGFLRDPATRRSLAGAPYGSYMQGASTPPGSRLYIRIEAFQADAAPLWDHLGFRLDLPVINSSVRDRDYRVYYDRALAELVESVCRDDITRFGYRF